MKIKLLLVILLFSYCYFSCSSKIFSKKDDDETVKNLSLVMKYFMEVEYPELFDDNPYKIQFLDIQFDDVDSNGIQDIFVLTYPHYHQSPPITIFQKVNSDSIYRITESLSPGVLEPVTRDYLDCHTIGFGVDLQIQDTSKVSNKNFVDAALSQGMNVVRYKNFYHLDKREGFGIYTDMSHQEKYSDKDNCSEFQFSKVDRILLGKVKGCLGKCLCAFTNNDITVYENISIRSGKYIDKKIHIIPMPDDIDNILLNDSGIVSLHKKNGSIIELHIE